MLRLQQFQQRQKVSKLYLELLRMARLKPGNGQNMQQHLVQVQSCFCHLLDIEPMMMKF